MANENNLVPFKKGYDSRRDGNGRPKGRKSLSTIIRELEDEQFDWKQLPIRNKKDIEQLISEFGPIGSPFRVIVFKALMDSIFGKGAEKSSAREFLRRSGYGDKLDLTTKGERLRQTPVIVSEIKKRHVDTETETTESPGVS